MKSLFTFSQTDLLLQCTYPFSEAVVWPVEETREEALWGIAWHEAASGAFSPKEACKRAGILDVQELSESVADGRKILNKWLRENEYGVDFTSKKAKVYREQSLAYNLDIDTTGATRMCDPPDPDTHVYRDRRPGEFCGTLDEGRIIPGVPGALLTLDYKTGRDIPEPRGAGQLLSGALALSELRKYSEPPSTIVLAYLHAPRGQIPTIYSHEVTFAALREHRQRILDARERIGNGYMRPGKHCTNLYCPARFICPTRDAELVENAIRLVPHVSNEMAMEIETASVANDALADGPRTALSRAERLGQIHEVVETYDRLRARLREEMQKELAEIGHGIRTDGDLIKLISISKRRISLGGIEKALGKMAGAREIARLDKMGCVTVSEEVQIRKVRDL